MSHRSRRCQNNKESSDVWKKKILSDCSCPGVFLFIISTGTNSAQPQVTLCFHDPSAVPWVNVHIISVARETRQAGALMFTVGRVKSRGCRFYYTIKSDLLWVQRLTMATPHTRRLARKKFCWWCGKSSWRIHKKRFHCLFISLANQSNLHPARSHQRAQTRRKRDDCTLSGLSLGEAASEHSAPVISELWFYRK